MTTWLKLLPMELEEIEELIEPPLEFNPQTERKIGEMSEDLKKLYTLWQNLEKEFAQQIVQARFARNERERKLTYLKLNETKERAEVLQRLFWISVRDEFKLWEEDTIAVRKGFLIVVVEEDRPRTIFDLLKGF